MFFAAKPRLASKALSSSKLPLLTPGLHINAPDVSIAVSMNYHELGPEASRTAVAVARETHVVPVQTVMRWTTVSFFPLWVITIAACVQTQWNPWVVGTLVPAMAAASAMVSRRALLQIATAKTKTQGSGAGD
jgi:hypothetical protein